MKSLRAIATPLTIGAFIIMSVTGILMFFHLNSGFNKLLHEWAGWAMVAGVALHVVVNWLPFKRYFLSSNSARAIIALGVLALAGSFTPMPEQQRGGNPAVMAMRAVSSAPISSVAPLVGKPVSQVIQDLANAGIVLPNAEASIQSVVGDDRGAMGKAMGILFKKG